MKFRILLILAVLLLAVTAIGREINVPGEYPTLQMAISASLPGDVIQLGRGRHSDSFLQLRDSVTIRGDRDNPAEYIIDAGSSGYVFRAEGVADVRLEGLTITGGHADGPSSYSASGGGIFVSRSSVTIERVIFRSNRAESSGGGVRAAYSEVELIDCEFRDCHAVKGGGAVDLSYDSDARVTGTSFEGNRAAWGGAVSARTGSSCLFDSCEFLGNSTLPPQDLGGAFFADHAARVTFRYCVLAGNSSRQGGAARLTGALVGLTNCTIDGNTATETGGAFMVRGGSIVLGNSIISFNNGDAVTVLDDADVWVSATDIHGNLDGDWVGPLAALRDQYGNLDADPLYCELGVYSLQESSPCDADNSGVGLIGALPAGCEDVSVLLESFQARAARNEVLIDWTINGGGGYAFRLTGRSEDDAEEPAWTVPYLNGDNPGRYTATDKPASSLYPVVYRLEVQQDDDTWSNLGERVVNRPIDTGDGLNIHSVFPNPFNPQVTVFFSLPHDMQVDVAVYDLKGRRVKTLARSVLPAGSHELYWDSRDEQGRAKATGTYILRVVGEGPALTRKLLLIK